MYCLSETLPCTASHNKSHNNKTCSYGASQNKPGSPMSKLPFLLLTVLFSAHRPDCSLPVPSCSQDSCSSTWQDLWCVSECVVCHAAGSWECSSVQVGEQGPACLQAKGDEDQVLLIRAQEERRRGREGNLCMEEKGGRIEEQEAVLEGNKK